MIKFTANLSMLFTEVDLIDRFQAAKACGFSAVEIQFPYALPAGVIAKQLASCLQKLVLFNVDADDLLQGGEGLACVPNKAEQFQAALARAIDYAKILKPVAINILPGRCFNTNHLPEYLNTFKANLRLAADGFAPLGIKTVFEAINTYDMPGFIINSSTQMLEVMAELNHPNLYMQYDIYHMCRMGENCAVFLSQQAEKIGHIQFADVPGRGQPGTGRLDFDGLFEVIRQSGYSGWCGAEYNPVGLTAESLGWLDKYASQ
jgi:hydroxypyruvate isomerase